MSGPTPSPFAPAQRALNHELSRKMKLRANRKLFNKYDLRYAYDKFNGSCSVCGLNLQAKSSQHGNNTRSAQFMLRTPLENNGKLSKDNLLLVCKRHKENKRFTSYPKTRTFGFNTFADIIAQLVAAVVDEDDRRIDSFKKHVNVMLDEFIQTLRHDMDLDEVEPLERYEFENTVPDLIVEIATAFKEIKKTKQYTVLRRNK